MLLRTAKSCGPDTPTLVSSLRMLFRPYRVQTKRQSASDGGKRARSPRRARRKPLKPLRAGMPGDSGVLVVTRVRSTTKIAHETAGAAGIRHSPRPQGGERSINGSGASRRGIANACLNCDLMSLRRVKRPTLRHSGAMPTGPRKARPDDRLRIEPGISRFRAWSFGPSRNDGV
jgi:hypothetical protein